MAVLISLSATRNPLYLILILLCIVTIYMNHKKDNEQPRASVSPIRFALVVIILTTLFNTLTSHFGETIFFTIPGKIPLLSGAITLEAVIYGVTNGLVLSGFFTSFLVLNQTLPIRSLLRMVPRAFYPLAVVISIAVTYIPVTRRQFTQIREAQAIRGYRLKGLRAWLPLIMPLLVGGLERALTLAEAMTARGFASTLEGPKGNYQRAFILSGTLLIPTAWIISMLNDDLATITVIIGLTGSALLIYGLWSAGKRTPHTIYHRENWKREDWAVILGVLFVLGAYFIPNSMTSGIDYSPYPRLTLPPFSPLIGIMTMGLLVPMVIHSPKS